MDALPKDNYVSGFHGDQIADLAIGELSPEHACETTVEQSIKRYLTVETCKRFTMKVKT